MQFAIQFRPLLWMCHNFKRMDFDGGSLHCIVRRFVYFICSIVYNVQSFSIHIFWKFFITFNSDTFNFTSSKIQIVAGTNEWKTGTHYNVSKIIVHNKFVLSDYINDIALIRTRSPIKLNDRIQPINFTSNAVEPDELLQTTGWGTLEVVH